MQSSRIQPSSKMEGFLKDFSTGLPQQQVKHSFCSCEICVNDVKPIPKPQELREKSTNQINHPPSQAFFFVLSKCTNYKGTLFIPEIIFLQEGMLCYTNQWGRLRIKDKISNQQAKKYFDQKKQKTRQLSKNLQKQKDSYVLVYKSGSQQIMTQNFYNKIISKRKNDPFWLQVAYSYKMPEPKDRLSSLKTYSYKRTKSQIEYMLPIMQKAMRDVDSNDEKLNRQQMLKNMSFVSFQQPISSNIQISQISKFSSAPNQINSLQVPMTNSQHFIEAQGLGYKFQRSKSRLSIYKIKQIVEEMIAYLEVSSKTRVLQLQLLYTQDVDGQPVIVHFQKLISCELSASQQIYLHDRYKELETIGQKQLIQYKKQLDTKDEQTLWNVCIEILQSCLEQRKIKLQIQNYKRPTKKTSKQIYSKFFPEFSPSLMFENINWKNQLPKFMSNTRHMINQIIESDEGISILKRFNIYFYRTF